MTSRVLTESIFEPDMRWVNFFNGRLLSEEDMRSEQDANRHERRRLGQAVGSGIAFGLEVSPAPGVDRATQPTLHIEAGLAIDRRGQPVHLGTAVDLVIVTPQAGGTGSSAATFSICDAADSGTYVAGAGLHLVTVRSVEGNQGRAPVSGLGNIEASCNVKYRVPGVSLRLIRLPLPNSELTDPGRLRNRTAYRCFLGSPQRQADFWANPLGPPVSTYGIIDDLRPNVLQDCEVPLAVVYLTAEAGLVFVDMWSARRRIADPAAASRFPLLIGDRYAAEVEAMIMQFQEQIASLQVDTPGSLGTIAASSRFRYLPPVGLLPIQAAGSAAGFNAATFFGVAGSNDVAMTDGRLLRGLWQEALDHAPIDLAGSEKIQLYLVWENSQAVANGQSPQLAMVFASAALPYCGVARFGYANYSLSHFANVVN